MSVGRVLTQGLGSFGGVQYLVTLGFGSGEAPPPPADDTFIRNFSLRHWREWKRDEDEELLEELVEIAESAVKSAESAAVARAEGRLDDQAALLRAMEARQAYEDAYKAALRERYVAEAVARQWMADMKRLRRRRAAIMLLLH